MVLIWHGTASIEVVNPSGRILFDPFVPLKGSKVKVGIGEFDGFDDIFVTHGHFDHISDLPAIIRRNPGTRIYCTDTPYRTLTKRGVPAENLSLVAHGQTLNLKGFSIRLYHGRHAVLPRASLRRIAYALRSPCRKNLIHFLWEHPRCPENDETVFYQIEAEGKRLSLMGSLNLRDDVDYPVRADLLVLAYNGWEDNLPPAVRAIERLSPKRVALDHYDDTFPPMTMPLDLAPILERYGTRIAPLELNRPVQI